MRGSSQQEISPEHPSRPHYGCRHLLGAIPRTVAVGRGRSASPRF